MGQKGFLQSAAQIVMGLSILFGLLLGFSLAFGDPGTGAYIVAQVTLVPVALMLVASVLIIRTGWEPF